LREIQAPLSNALLEIQASPSNVLREIQASPLNALLEVQTPLSDALREIRASISAITIHFTKEVSAKKDFEDDFSGDDTPSNSKSSDEYSMLDDNDTTPIRLKRSLSM